MTPTETRATERRSVRDAGSGCLIPPRPGVSKYWAVQFNDTNGKKVRRSRFPQTGKKIAGELKAGHDPKRPESWTNISAAKDMARAWAKEIDGGVTVGNDPSQLHYADLRKLFISDYAEQGMSSLHRNAETGEAYVCGLGHIDKFFGYEKDGDRGSKVSQITTARVDAFKAQRQTEGAANGTINRSLASLRRMFTLGKEKLGFQTAPAIKMLPEPTQPRQGFLEVADYEKLHAALPEYVRPLLQVGYYTGMRLGEILNLQWGNVDLAHNCIRLNPDQTKNRTARIIPLIDGLPETLELIRQKNPTAGENDPVFLGSTGLPIGSFIKAWRNACIKAAIKTRLDGRDIVSHFEEDGTYQGFIFHDLRRSAIRNLIRAGVDQTVAKKISGHKTDSVFERYNVTSEDDLQEAALKVASLIQQNREAPAKSARLRAVK